MPVGAVISAEPGVYIPGRLGVRIEDVLILKEGGYEDITCSPKDLIVLGPQGALTERPRYGSPTGAADLWEKERRHGQGEDLLFHRAPAR